MNPVVHFELPARDRERSAAFYEKAFGWKMLRMGESMGNYIMVQTGPTKENGMLEQTNMINGGIYEPDENMPNQAPSVVVHVDDIARHIPVVQAAGGTVLGEPMDIPGVGKYVAFKDPEGNQLSMLQPTAPMA